MYVLILPMFPTPFVFWGEHMSVILFIHFLVILLFFNPSFILKIHLSLADIFYEHVQPNIINDIKSTNHTQKPVKDLAIYGIVFYDPPIVLPRNTIYIYIYNVDRKI